RDPGQLHPRVQRADVRLRHDSPGSLHFVCRWRQGGSQELISVRRPVFIARQAERPTGLLGRALGAIMALETRSLNDEVLQRLAIAPSERILEIGFGHGRTLERAARASTGARF